MKVGSARLLISVTAAALVLSGCGAAGSTTAASSPPSSTHISPTPSGSGSSSAPPSSTEPPPPSCVRTVFDAMSPAQRVGQLFVVGLRDDLLTDDEIAGVRHHHFGSFSFTATTTEGVDAVRRVTDAIQDLTTPATTADVGFFVAANQEGGQIQALGGSGFSTIPSAVEQGALPPAALRRDAERWGRELVAAGVNLDFAPVMDVVPAGTESENQPIGALDRQFGSDPASVGVHGVAFIHGMQGAGVATTAKHFPGLGRVVGNTDLTANVVDTVTTPDDPYLAPFRAAIAAGVPFVMVALATYTRIDPHHLAVFSPTVMRLLRRTYGFDGVIVSDDIGAAEAISQIPPATRAIDFLRAGGDLIASKDVQPANEMADAISAEAAADPVFQRLVDAATLRVLRAKDVAGLLPCDG